MNRGFNQRLESKQTVRTVNYSAYLKFPVAVTSDMSKDLLDAFEQQ